MISITVLIIIISRISLKYIGTWTIVCHLYGLLKALALEEDTMLYIYQLKFYSDASGR